MSAVFNEQSTAISIRRSDPRDTVRGPRLLGRRQYRQPVRVVFEEPIPLSAVIEQTGLDPAAITEYLQTHYRTLGF